METSKLPLFKASELAFLRTSKTGPLGRTQEEIIKEVKIFLLLTWKEQLSQNAGALCYFGKDL